MPAKVRAPEFHGITDDGFLSLTPQAPPAPVQQAPPENVWVTALNSALENPAVQSFIMAGANLMAVKAEQARNGKKKETNELVVKDTAGNEVTLPTPVFGGEKIV